MNRLLAPLAAIFALFATVALAQGTVQQSGPVVPFHTPIWFQNGIVGDGGTPASPNSNSLGLFNGSNCPFGISSQTGPATSTAEHSQLQICQSDTATTFVINGVNGEPTPSVFFNIGGTLFPFPGPGSGNVVGPNTSAVGDLACFSSTTGVLIGSCAGTATLPSRASIATAHITKAALVVGGYYAAGDLGAGANYTSSGCTSSGLQAIADADGVYYCLVVNGPAIPGQFGAYGDAMFAFFTDTVIANPCMLTVANIGQNGVIRPGDTLVGDGVTPGGTILAFGTNGTTGTGRNGTYALSTCTAAPKPSFTGSLAPNSADATGLTSILTVSGLTGTLAPNQTIAATAGNITANTQIISGSGTTYIVSQGGQTVASEPMTSTLNGVTYGGHDDSAAVIAAAATGNDVLVEGPLVNSNQVNYVGMLAGVTLTARHQRMKMGSARFLALPGFVGDYVVTAGGSQQEFDRVVVDGGGVINQYLPASQQMFVGGILCSGSATDPIFNDIQVIHMETIGLDLSNSCRVNGKNLNQWNNLEPWLNSWSLTAIDMYWNHADSSDAGGSAVWAKVGNYFDCPSLTETIHQTHPFSGNTPEQGGAAFLDPTNFLFEACARGPDQIVGLYDDDGKTDNYSSSVILDGVWPLAPNTVSTYSNGCFINEYASGQSGQDAQEAYRLYLQGDLPGLTFICHNDNPHLATVTGASGDGTHVTLTLAPAPAVQSVGVLTTGTTVRYRVAWWPVGHPLVGDTVVASGFGNSAYNGTFTVGSVNPFYVTVNNTATGSPGTLGTIQPASTWTSEMLQPSSAATRGFINVTGTPSCSRCPVIGATANSVTFASTATTGFVNGTVQFAHAGDFSGLPGLEGNFYNGTIYGGDRLDVFLATNFPYVQEYAPANDITGGIGHTYQIGGGSAFYTESFTNTGMTEGAVSGLSTHTLGLETNAPSLTDNGSQLLSINSAGFCHWSFLNGGAFVPCTGSGSGGGRNIGASGNPVGVIYSTIDNAKAQTLAQLNTADPSPSAGDSAYITDATSCATFNAAVTGGGASQCRVHWNSVTAAWTAG